MSRIPHIVTLLSLALAAVAPSPGAETSGDDVMAVARSNNDFALDLYARLAAAEQGRNVFFSPASISTALAMTYAGARGDTATEMHRTLRFTLDDERIHAAMGELLQVLTAQDAGHEVSIANALWGQQGLPFEESFLALTRERYGAGLQEVDFRSATEEARQTINRWVEQKTRDRIKDLLKPGVLDALTKLVLTNAIYFKGTWQTRFDPQRTLEEPFRLDGGGTTKVRMMHLRNQRFPFLSASGFRAIELPYAGETTSMLLVVPEEGVSLAEFEKTLSRERLEGWVRDLRSTELDDVAIPRFEMTLDHELAPYLSELGMRAAFGGRADFSGMTGKRDLFVSNVVHKAFVQVNEEGTEAAAATAVVMMRASVRPPVVFRADRPFVFMIRDRATGAILFMGRVARPD